MRSQYQSVSFGIRVLVFASIFAFIQLLLEYARTSQASILSFAVSFVGGVLLAFVIGSIFVQLPYNLAIRVGTMWLALFVIQQFSNIVEALFFTTYLPTTALFLAAALLGLVITFIEALAGAFLFHPQKPARSLAVDVRTYFNQRSSMSWMLRFAVGSLAYFPIYFTFGAMISPFVLPYYLDSSMGLSIPSFTVMIPLEFFRGFLYVIALFPIIAASRSGRKRTYLLTASLLYVAGAFVSFLTVSGFPVQLRIFHGVEILADCLVYAAILVYLFARSDK